MARDEFSRVVIEKVRSRVVHRCSNPDCRVPTSAPLESDNVKNIGQAAHICAASPGGPRYDASMTPEERKSIENGIWLCSNCAAEIDRDEKKYTVEVLKEWKKKAEDYASKELGKKLPSNNETINTVTEALTGLPKGYIPRAVSNVHEATAKSLEALDPRFLVKTTHADDLTSIEIHAKERDVNLSMTFSEEKAEEFIKKHQQLTEHGEDFDLRTEGISIEGSRLFEEIFGKEQGTLRVSSNNLSGIQKLWLAEKETEKKEYFDDILGSISLGSESLTFNGTACDGLFNIRYQKCLSTDGYSDINFSVCFDQWVGVDLQLLPHFDKLYSLFSKMIEGWELFTCLEYKGLQLFKSGGINTDDQDWVLRIFNLLHYINCCKLISRRLGHDINYDPENLRITADKHKYLERVAKIIEGKIIYDDTQIDSNATNKLIVNAECQNVKHLAEASEPMNIRVSQEQGTRVEIFGVSVDIPPEIVYLNSVLPKIHGQIDELTEGDVVEIEWVPQKDFRCIFSFQ